MCKRTGDDFNGMLAIEHIIDAVATAHLDRVDLVDVEFFQSFADMVLGQRALVVLVGDQISDGD